MNSQTVSTRRGCRPARVRAGPTFPSTIAAVTVAMTPDRWNQSARR